MSNVFNPSVKALRSEGVQCDFAVVRQNDDSEWEATGEVEKKKIRFSNRVLAELEDTYGDLQVWSNMVDERPNATVLTTLSIVFQKERNEVGEMIMTKHIEEYQFAVLTAWLLSMGAENNDELGKLVEQGQRIAELKPKLVTQMVSQFVPSLGEVGSEVGFDSDTSSMTSGSEPPAKSSSSSTNDSNSIESNTGSPTPKKARAKKVQQEQKDDDQ